MKTKVITIKNINNIKVSVIVPVYNAEKYLRYCLNSLKSQTLSNIEFICVNDGSTDKSLEILNEYAKNDSRFIVLNQENRGSGQARNNALKIAQGEYIGFVDSDDIVSKNYFKALYTASKNGKYDIVATSKIKLFKDGDKKTRRKHVGLRNRKYLVKDNYEKSNIILASGVAWNKIYKRDFINQSKISFIDVKSSAEDNYFTDCAIIRAKEIKVINNVTYFYRENPISQTKVKIDIKSALNAFDVYSRIIDYIKNNVSKDIQTIWIDVIKRRAKLDIFTYLFENLKDEEKKEFLNIANEKFKEFPTTLVVSLTSFPARINFVYKTIETLLNQSLKADRVILWLAEEQFENKEESLPKALLDLRERGLEIKWCEDIKSYKKLIPTLEECPNSIVVTADDDILYPNNWLKDLYRNYLQNPNEIQCYRAHRISFDKNGNVLPYKDWIFEIFNLKSSYNNFFTGCGGVLYPPNSLYKDILNKKLFTKLCPTADDIWFWAMAVLNNTKINVISKKNKFELKYVEGSQDNNCLWKINVYENRNDIQLKNIFEYYPQLLEKLDKKNIKEPYKVRNFSFFEKIFSITTMNINNKKRITIIILGLKLTFKL